MSLPFEIENRRAEIAAEVQQQGAELLEIHFRSAQGRSVITLIVDRPGGVTLEDCVRVNRRISAWLDELSAAYEAEAADFIKGNYYLEVNSPGIDRPLKTEKDFVRAQGRPVKITWRDAEGKVRTITGDVEAATAQAVTIHEAGGGHSVHIDLASVIKAQRDVRFKP